MTLLLPCPFCGHKTAPKLCEFDEPGYGFAVFCNSKTDDPENIGCGAAGGWAQRPEGAVALWNWRASAEVVEPSAP